MALGFPGGSDSKESACNAGDQCSIPGLGRSPGEGNGYPLQCYGLENSMDREAWQAIVHGVAKSWTQLSDFHSKMVFITIKTCWRQSRAHCMLLVCCTLFEYHTVCVYKNHGFDHTWLLDARNLKSKCAKPKSLPQNSVHISKHSKIP